LTIDNCQFDATGLSFRPRRSRVEESSHFVYPGSKIGAKIPRLVSLARNDNIVVIFSFVGAGPRRPENLPCANSAVGASPSQLTIVNCQLSINGTETRPLRSYLQYLIISLSPISPSNISNMTEAICPHWVDSCRFIGILPKKYSGFCNKMSKGTCKLRKRRI